MSGLISWQPLRATAIADEFGRVLARWFALHKELGPALDLYLSAQYQRSTHLENRFLNTAGAAEAYHRRTDPPPADVVDKHHERVKRITKAFPDKNDREWLRWKLKYAYEPSFADRLEQLTERCSEVLGSWLGDAAAFAERVSDARNLLVHRDPSPEAELPGGRDILDMAEDVALVLLVCLYQDLDVDNDRIREMLQRTPRWRFLEFRKRGWRDVTP